MLPKSFQDGFEDRFEDRIADGLPERLERCLALPNRPGAPRRFISELTYGRHKGPAASDTRRAAVMILLHPTEQGWSLPLTLRPADLQPHGGQISLPGGVIEAGETSEQAACRELEEELGVPAATIRTLGTLSDVYVYASNHLVTPWIGVCERHPQWQPHDAEVAEVIELSLRHLANPENLKFTCRCVAGIQFRSPHIAIGRHQVWGATCLILGELISLLEVAGIAVIYTPRGQDRVV